MDYRRILITGGAGFVGSTYAIWLATRRQGLSITVADNLKRRGSELNLPRLREHGIGFVHADIRNPEDLRLDDLRPDLIIECSAEPSVLAGYGAGSEYVVRTNLVGTLNCLELAARCHSDVLFLSTSRVYPIAPLNSITVIENDDRFDIAPQQELAGISAAGVSEAFPLEGARTLYGATKLASELLLQEYAEMHGLRSVITRCGVITGPWQMGKVDQGVFALWMAAHHFQRSLSYIGWGGSGKQVRDLIFADDLCELLDILLERMEELSGATFNVGGGADCSLSLKETTALCRRITGQTVAIGSDPAERPGDVRLYVTDNARVTQRTGWRPRHSPEQALTAIHEWIVGHEALLRPLWAN
jgi:CDP-paratose 2-epimerase